MRVHDRRGNRSERNLQLLALDAAHELDGNQRRFFRDPKSPASPPPRARLKVRPNAHSATPPAAGEPVTRSRPANSQSVQTVDPAAWPGLTNLPVPSQARLRALFDLTPAEARLAQALARGDALEEVADDLN